MAFCGQPNGSSCTTGTQCASTVCVANLCGEPNGASCASALIVAIMKETSVSDLLAEAATTVVKRDLKKLLGKLDTCAMPNRL